MIDLHTHTYHSDGTLSPKELIRRANGLTAVAITDHDSIHGLDEAQVEADRLGITFVPGIEFSVAYGEGRLIHILGLGIDPGNKNFLNSYNKYRQIRSVRLLPVFNKLQAMNVPIGPEDVEPFIDCSGFMDRQAIAKCILARGYALSLKDSWEGYLDFIPYGEGELIEPEAAFDAIHCAGGKAFLAHFHLPIGLEGYSDEEARRRLGELKTMGLDGMEYWYPSFSGEDRECCRRYIEEFGFLRSGGTDFHGANRPHIELGTGKGNFCVPDELLKEILSDTIIV